MNKDRFRICPKGCAGLFARKYLILPLLITAALLSGCSISTQNGSSNLLPGQTDGTIPSDTQKSTPNPVKDRPTATPPASPTVTITPTPTATEIVFEIGEQLTINYLRGLDITGSEITIERELPANFYYRRQIVSYISEGNKIYGLLMTPYIEQPENGYKAIVFNHGYIPPEYYRTEMRYEAYVDYLARSGFVVFKIDYRGHGQSEGEPSGSYFSPGYTIDSIAALKSLQTLDYVDPQGIGMWGHSMAGNLTLRAMLIEPDVKAGVIWAGAVYSYEDFAEYGIDDNTYRPPATPEGEERPRRSRQIFEVYGRPGSGHPFWDAVSLTENIEYLNSPLQIHHAVDDPVVSIQYSQGLAEVMQENGKEYEFYIYEGGGHNIISPYFGQAMQRTVEFFRDNL
jgi:dipeptidyl aminopeptidase/acylaminoacyl peptidase